MAVQLYGWGRDQNWLLPHNEDEVEVRCEVYTLRFMKRVTAVKAVSLWRVNGGSGVDGRARY